MKKKILILLALLMALTLVFVACKDDPVPPEETTVADQPTEEPTQGDEDPTEAPDTDDQTHEPEETTDEPDESETPKPEDPTKEPDTPTQEPETQDPMEPVNVFDAEDIQTVTGSDPNNMTQDCLTLEDGYIHVVPLGADPYWYPFASVDGARYVAIRYRTDATGADMQLYMSSTGTGPTDDTTMIRQPVVADGEWQLVIFDTQSLIDAGKYDGKYVSYFRFDPLEAGYILDENGEPYKDESGQWARHSLPEGCSIDVAYIAFFHSEEAAKMYDFEQYKAPIWTASGFVTHLSFDELDKYAGETRVEGVFTPGQSSSWDHIITLNDFTVDTLQYYGWVSGTGNLGQFGYQINGGSAIYNDEWTHEADMMAHAPAGSDHARRMQIWISLAGLEGENSIRVLYKNAEGAEACLSEFTVILPEKPKDITNTFASDITSVAAGTALNATDLSNYFTAMLNLGQYLSVDGAYVMDGISEIFADVNGKYALTVDFAAGSNGAYAAIVRGVHAVNSTQGEMKINNFYETDGAGFGGAGIYACVINGNLKLTVKTFDPSITTCVKNVEYNLPCTGNKLTMADDGETVYVMVDGVVYATFAISGSVEYPAENISLVSPATTFAETVVVSLIDGTTETLTNTLVDSTCETQIALAVRGGSFNFSSVKVEGFSAVEIPEFEIVTPEDPEPVDPDAPVLVLTPEFINGQAHSTVITQAQCIGSSEIITEDEITFVRLTANGGDPYVALVDLGSYLELPQYMAFAYRTNSGTDAQIFIGSGTGWSGNGDVTSLAWNEDGNWNSAILDLGNVGLTSINNGIISYCRFDFFTDQGAEGDYLDVEYVAFFNSAEAAEKYFNNLHETELPHEHVYESVVTAPTCTEQGYTTHTCSCGDSYVDSYVDAIGHNFVFGTCTVCGETDPDYVPTPEEIVNAAYGLAEGATLSGTYTLTGVITDIESAWSEQYKNISVWMQIGDMSDKLILAFRVAGDGASTLKKGDTITVTGTLTNYQGKIEFAQGCTLDAVVPGEEPEPEDPTIPGMNNVTIDFGDHTYRTEEGTDYQIFTNGDFVFTQSKGSSNSWNTSYIGPIRLYVGHDVTIAYPGMTKIVIDGNSGKPQSGWTDSISDENATVTINGNTVTIEFATPVDSFTVTFVAQVRVNAITVYAPDAEEPASNEIIVTTTDMYTWVDMIQFTAPVSGVYTFTLPAGLGAWDAIESDTNPYSSSPFIDFNTQQEGGSFSVEIAANDTYSFYIGAFTKADWVITWTVEEKEVVGGGDEPGTEEPEIPSVDFSGTYYHADGYLVIDSIAGTMTHYYDTEYVFDYTFTVTDGVVALSNQYGPINEGMAVYMGKLALGEDGKPVTFWYNGVEYALSTEAPEPIVPDIPVGGNVLNLGPNTVTVTDDIITAGGVEYTFVAEAEGTYTFVSDFFVRITDALGISYNNNSNLTAGTYTVSLGTMFISEAGNYTVNVEFVPAAEDGDDFVAPEDAVEFPYTLTVEGEHDIYFNFAPAEDCVVKITYTAGNYVSGLTDYDPNTEECYYIARFTGKQVYNINPWGSSAGTYTFEYYTEE